MRFQSTLLSAKNTEYSDIQNLVECNNPRPRIYDMLEYNSDIQDIDLTLKLEQYKYMVEAVFANDNGQTLSNINENMISSIINKLIEWISTIIQFIKDSVKKFFGMFKKKDAEIKEEFKRIENIDLNDDVWNKRGTFNIFCYPDINTINGNDFLNTIKPLTMTLNALSTNPSSNMTSSVDTAGILYKNKISKLLTGIKSSREPVSRYQGKIVDSKSFSNYVKTELCFYVKEEMTIRDWYDKYFKAYAASANNNNDSIYASHKKVFENVLAESKKTLEGCLNNKSLSQDVAKTMQTIVATIEQVSMSYNELISTIEKYHLRATDYALAVAKNIKSGDHTGDYSNDEKYKDYTNESGMIHGEEFNSDTLFDNEDMRDFNRTEWLDLNLTVECYTMKHKLTEIRKRIAIQEACILADEEPRKIIRLNAMREAEEKKSNSVIMSIINKIKEFFTKFTQIFNEKFNSITKYIHDNRQYIDKPVTIKSMSSKGDIIAGMYRCQNNINVIPFDYNAMKADLVDKKTFFKNKILPTLGKNNQTSKRKLEWTDDMDIATYCKIYFGASIPEDKYPKCEYTGAEMEQNKKNIIRFLTEKNISFSAKKDLDNLEHESKRMNASVSTNTPTSNGEAKSDTSASTTSTTSSASGSSSASTATPKDESMYYSELYERWITEADIDAGVAKEGEKPASTPNNDIYNAYRVYMEAYKDVILAKMTGCEFIVSELKQFISVHSVNNGGKPIPSGAKEEKK